MQIERQMFAIIEKLYKEVSLQNNARQMSSIKTNTLMNSARNTIHYTVMTFDTAFISS